MKQRLAYCPLSENWGRSKVETMELLYIVHLRCLNGFTFFLSPYKRELVDPGKIRLVQDFFWIILSVTVTFS
jgi:hypothetical protein